MTERRFGVERQHPMLQTIRSLLQDGLFKVGDITARGDPGFLAWPETLDEVMERLTERIAGRYDNPGSWECATWLNSPLEGERATAAVTHKIWRVHE